ncbi:hypothetical protein FS749_014162 [Ceratobasidium sp. UAMH 11750]|nr:hypothetical protein FS749_014162 [Ceratobasidium sp. UAMH 11750]
MSVRPIPRISSREALVYAQQAEPNSKNDVFGLTSNERDWAKYYDYLKDRGYQLRPRYSPGWVRSWLGQKVFPNDCEDSWAAFSALTMDAVRLSDNQQVMLKKLLPCEDDSADDGRNELDIIRYLSSEDRLLDPKNHCARYLDSFPIPDVDDGVFLATPLYVPWNYPEHDTVGEIVDFLGQIFEGLEFMHANHVAHRDCTPPNIMMDWRPLVDEAWHPVERQYTLDGSRYLDIRARHEDTKPVVYYFIDFGLSVRFRNEEGRRLVTGSHGREQTVPEIRKTEPYDPFKVDIFILGAFVERDIVNHFHGFSFLRPLLSQMKRTDPKARPTAAEVAKQYAYLRAQIPPRNLEWELITRDSGLYIAALFAFHGMVNRTIFTVQKFLRLLHITS